MGITPLRIINRKHILLTIIVTISLLAFGVYYYHGSNNIILLPETGGIVSSEEKFPINVKEDYEKLFPPMKKDSIKTKVKKQRKASISETAIVQKVLVIIYDAHELPGHESYYYPDDGVQGLAPLLETDLEKASIFHGFDPLENNEAQIDYQIYNTIIHNEESPLLPGQTGSGATDYNSIIDEHNICGLINEGTIDEVWLWSDRSGGYWEANMFGPVSGAFSTNGPVVIRNDCSKAAHIMGFNYEVFYDYKYDDQGQIHYLYPSSAYSLHSFGHRIENTITHFLDEGRDRVTVVDGDDWYEYGGQYSFNGEYFYSAEGSCGNIHWPTNVTLGTPGYQYSNLMERDTDCKYFNTQHTGDSEIVTSEEWNGWQGEYMKYFMQNMPGRCNQQVTNDGGAMPNWWELILKSNTQPESSDACPKITGTILNSSNTNISNLPIKLYDSNNTLIETKTSGNEGQYSFSDIRPGTYKLVVPCQTNPQSLGRLEGSGESNIFQVSSTGTTIKNIHISDIYCYKEPTFTAELVCSDGSLSDENVRLFYANWPPNPLNWNYYPLLSNPDGSQSPITKQIPELSESNIYIGLAYAGDGENFDAHTFTPIEFPDTMVSGTYFNPPTQMLKWTYTDIEDKGEIHSLQFQDPECSTSVDNTCQCDLWSVTYDNCSVGYTPICTGKFSCGCNELAPPTLTPQPTLPPLTPVINTYCSGNISKATISWEGESTKAYYSDIWDEDNTWYHSHLPAGVLNHQRTAADDYTTSYGGSTPMPDLVWGNEYTVKTYDVEANAYSDAVIFTAESCSQNTKVYLKKSLLDKLTIIIPLKNKLEK